MVSGGDVLLIRGPEEGVNHVRELAGAPPLPEAPGDGAPPLSELDRAVDILVELKDLAEAAVGLAYSALLFNNRSLAAEVGTLEARIATSCTTSSNPGSFARRPRLAIPMRSEASFDSAPRRSTSATRPAT